MSPLKRREMSAAGALVTALAGEWFPAYAGMTIKLENILKNTVNE